MNTLIEKLLTSEVSLINVALLSLIANGVAVGAFFILKRIYAYLKKLAFRYGYKLWYKWNLKDNHPDLMKNPYGQKGYTPTQASTTSKPPKGGSGIPPKKKK